MTSIAVSADETIKCPECSATRLALISGASLDGTTWARFQCLGCRHAFDVHSAPADNENQTR